MVPYNIILYIYTFYIAVQLYIYIVCTKYRMAWTTSRGFILYNFFIFHPTYKVLCIVSKQNRREIAHFEQKGKTSREGREVEENAMEWLLKKSKEKNNSNNNIRKFILKAYSIYFFFLSFFHFFSFRSKFFFFIFLRTYLLVVRSKRRSVRYDESTQQG